MLLLVVADLNRRAADAMVTVKGGADAKRAIHVVQGMLIAADSNLKAERLGDMLAGEGRLDPVLIEPVANEARRRGTLLGDQLVADGLLTPSDLAAALERQVRLRFHSALACPGSVNVAPKSNSRPFAKIPLGAAITGAFRERITLSAINELVADRPTPSMALNLEDEAFKRLELGPAALKVCRGLASGEPFNKLVQESSSPEGVQRTVGVLVGLGLWS